MAGDSIDGNLNGRSGNCRTSGFLSGTDFPADRAGCGIDAGWTCKYLDHGLYCPDSCKKEKSGRTVRAERVRKYSEFYCTKQVKNDSRNAIMNCGNL